MPPEDNSKKPNIIKSVPSAKKYNASKTEPDFRPYSSRDESYEQIQQVSDKNSKVGSTGYNLNAAERELTLMVMVRNMRDEFETLKNEAVMNKDQLALKCLHTIAFESTRQLLLLSQYEPELVAEVAQFEQVWPVLCGKEGILKNTADRLVEILEVGTKRDGVFDANNVLSESTEAREWLAIIAGLINRLRQELAQITTRNKLLTKTNAVTAQIVRSLAGGPSENATDDEVYEHLKGIVIHPDEMARLIALFEKEDPFEKSDTLKSFITNASRLPELRPDKEVIKAWMQVIRKMIMDVYDGNPEKNPEIPSYFLAQLRKEYHLLRLLEVKHPNPMHEN